MSLFLHPMVNQKYLGGLGPHIALLVLSHCAFFGDCFSVIHIKLQCVSTYCSYRLSSGNTPARHIVLLDMVLLLPTLSALQTRCHVITTKLKSSVDCSQTAYGLASLPALEYSYVQICERCAHYPGNSNPILSRSGEEIKSK